MTTNSPYLQKDADGNWAIVDLLDARLAFDTILNPPQDVDPVADRKQAQQKLKELERQAIPAKTSSNPTNPETTQK